MYCISLPFQKRVFYVVIWSLVLTQPEQLIQVRQARHFNKLNTYLTPLFKNCLFSMHINLKYIYGHIILYIYTYLFSIICLTNKELRLSHVLYCDKTRRTFENTREMLKSRAQARNDITASAPISVAFSHG
jgi:hypothetical protein